MFFILLGSYVIMPLPVRTEPFPVVDSGVVPLMAEGALTFLGISGSTLMDVLSTDGCLEEKPIRLAALVYLSTLESLLGGRL